MSNSFSEIARRILLIEKVRPLRDVACDMGIEYATLYSRVTGRSAFKPEEMRELILRVPDIRLVDSLLDGTRFTAVERVSETGWGNGAEAMDAALKSAQQLIEVLFDLHTNSAKQAEGVDRRHIETHVNEAERALLRLKLALPHLPAISARDAA